MANVGHRVREFVVEIEGSESPNITRVIGLPEGNAGVIGPLDGGAHINPKIGSGIRNYGEMTLERNLDGSKADADFKVWFQKMFAIEDTRTGSRLRRNGFIVVKEHQQEIMRFVFEGAWIKSAKFSDLDASSSGLLQHTIVLAIERMQRV